MPVKNNNKPLTKTIYINWQEQEVYTKDQYEDHLNAVLEEILEDESVLGEWISDNLNYREVGRLVVSEEYRAEVMAEYENYCRDRIREEDEEEWQEVVVTF